MTRRGRLSKAARFLRLRAAVEGEVACGAPGGVYVSCTRPVHDDEAGGGTHAAHAANPDRPFATWHDGERATLTGEGLESP